MGIAFATMIGRIKSSITIEWAT